MSSDDQNSISSADSFLVYDLLGAQVFTFCVKREIGFLFAFGENIVFCKRGQNHFNKKQPFLKKNTKNLVLCKNHEFLHHILIRI